MVIVDASVLIGWLAGQPQDDLAELLAFGQVALAPVTITELLSGRTAGERVGVLLQGVSRLRLRRGYWERAGRLRGAVLSAGRRAGLGDALLAQACLDHDLPLLTRDREFAAFVEVGGLRLA